MTIFAHSQRMHKQQGAVLLFSLIILLMLTVIGVAAMQTTTLQERMAGNFRDRQVAFQGAEAALVGVEQRLLQEGGNVVLHHWDTNRAPNPRDFEQASLTVFEITYQELRDMLADDPQYFIEERPPITAPGGGLEADQPLPEAELYRVVVRSTGASGDSDVVLQSYFRR